MNERPSLIQMIHKLKQFEIIKDNASIDSFAVQSAWNSIASEQKAPKEQFPQASTPRV